MQTITIIFLLILAVILSVPLVCRKVRVPSMVGFIVAGMVLGPHALGVIPSNQMMDAIGKMGMLYILFQSGVELDLNDFRHYMRRSLTLGLLSFLIPAVAGYGMAHWLFGMSIQTSLLVAAMLGSHTLMTYPIVARYGVSKSRSVNIAVGGSMIAITLALVMLVVVESGVAEPRGWVQMAQEVSLLVLFGLVVLRWIPQLAQWLLRHRIDTASQFMMVMLMLVTSSLMAEMAGIDGILGAFLCGWVLNARIPNRSQLMDYIHLTGSTMLVPVFLIGVGMMIDVHVLWSGAFVWVLALLMTGTKLVGKWLAAALVQWRFAMTATERQLMFGLTHSAAAGTLAIATVGYSLGVLDAEVMNATVMMIMVLCTSSSFATEVSAKRQALREESQLESDRDEDRWVLMGNPGAQEIRQLASLSSLPDPIYVPVKSWKEAVEKVESSWESTIIYKEEQPLQTINRIRVTVPRHAEKEHDFISCFGQIRRLSSELGARVVFYCTDESRETLQAFCQRQGKYLRAEYRTLSDYQDILQVQKEAERDDLIVIITARKGTVSYDTIFRLLPNMVERFFSKYSWILLYPEQGK